jgi:hypothetical protein
MRLAYDKTGAVRFSQAGRPVVRVAKELSDNVRLVRDNFTANLISYAGDVMTEHETEYRQQVETARKAGEPIAQHDRLELSKALEAKAEAEAQAVTEAYTKAHAEAHAEANTEREAVAV